MSLLKRNIGWNFTGAAAPALFSIASIPILLNNLATQDAAILFIALMLVGFSGLFDFGIGRGITKAVVQCDEKKDAPCAVCALVSGIVMLGILIFGLVILGWVGYDDATSYVVGRFHVTQDNGRILIILLALVIIVVISSTPFIAFLEARGRFKELNIARSVTAAGIYGGPAVVSFICNDAISLVALVLVVRSGLLLALLWLVMRRRQTPRWVLSAFSTSAAFSILTFSGWIAVTNFIGPVLLYADRVIVVELVDLKEFAYYAALGEVLLKSFIVPNALASVLFPYFVKARSEQQGSHSVLLKTLSGFFGIYVVVLASYSLFGEELLKMWFGSEVPSSILTVAPILICGVLVNWFSIITLSFTQASGWQRAPAIFQLVLIAPYLYLLIYAGSEAGLHGIALVWLGRIVITAVFIHIVSIVARMRPTPLAALATSPVISGPRVQ